MNMFANLATDDSIQNEVDSVGGSGPLDSGIYASKVNMAYAITSKGGAQGIVLNLTTDQNRDIRQTLWVSSGNSKGNKNYYETQNGERKYLPGFLLFQSLGLLTVGKEVTELDIQEKTINVYDSDAKKEVPTQVPVVMDLLDQEIYTAIFKQTVDKRAKGDDGNYHPTGETRDENEIDKFFRASDKLTTAEIRAGAEEAVFFDTWETKWKGETRDKTSKDAPKAGSPTPMAAAAKPAAGGAPKTSLFNQKSA